jgi:hypothetical protein
MCGKANPDSLEECQFCGARLRPLVLPQTSNLQLPPDWDKPKPAATPPAEPAKPKPDSDWLHQLRGDAPSSASAQPFKETASLPDWLGANDDAGPGVDDWLSRLRDHDQADSQEDEEPISEDILRSRLGELGEAPPSEPEGGLPGWLSSDSAKSDDWLKSFDAEPEKPKPQPGLSDFAKMAAAPAPEEEDDTDDWLKSFGAEPETPKPQLGLSDFAKMAAAPAPEEEDDSDSWLQSFGATPAPAEPAEPGLPDWLKTGASEPPAGEQAFKQTASFPDWLGAPPAPAGEAKDDAADWLKSLSNAGQPAASPEPAAELPAWLDNLTSSSAPASDQPPSALSRTATLDWLSSDAGPALPHGGASRSEVEGPAPAEPASTPPPAAKPESDIPDWLSRLTSSSAPPSDQPPSALSRTATLDWLSSDQPAETPEADLPRADLPDWLKPAAGATPPAAAPAIAGTGALDWLGPSQPAQPSEASQTGDLPDWLKAMTPPTGDQPAPPSELPEPDWIISADTQPGPQAESPRPSLKKTSELKADTFSLHSPTGTDPALVGSDDWLKSLDAGEPAAPTSAQSGEPDWLSSLRPPDASAPASGAPAFDAGDQATIPAGAPGGDLPDWLASMRPSGLDSAPPFAADVEAGKTEAISPADMPAWLAPSAGPAATVPMPPFRARAEEGAAGEADLTKGALPSWLQAMRPIDLNAPSVDLAPEREETAGPLAGMRGILPAESVISVPGKPGAVVTRFVVSDLEAQQAELFRSIISEETQESTAAKPRPKARFSYAFDRLLIAIVLLAAVLAPYLIGDLGLFRPPDLEKLPEPLKSFYAEIETLPVDQPVLIAFEYEPGSTGELNPGVKAVIAHLLRLHVPVAVTSTSPAGFGVAQEVLKEAGLAPEDEGNKYFNLPYIAGGASGLQQFALKLPVEATARGYSNFSLIIVATSSAESAQAWIEQVQPVAKVKLAAVASAAAEPMLYPYYQSEQKQLAGLVSGLAGGLLYAAKSSGAAPVEAWSAYSYGLNAAGAILALGAFVGVVMVLLTRRETQPARPQPKAEAPAESATPQSELKRRSPKSKKPRAGKTAKAKKNK